MCERDTERCPIPGVSRAARGAHGDRALRPDGRPRVLLADDYPAFLMALKRLLEPSYAVVATVRTGADALEAAECLQPDVMVTDVRLPDIDGLEVCRRVRTGGMHTRVVIITAADDPEVEQRALELGASGFVLKYQAGNDLVPAIERALMSPAA